MSQNYNVRELAFETIQSILNEGAYSNIEINHVLTQNPMSSADKGLFTELIYGTIKRKLTLDFYLKPFIQTRVKGWVRQLLWMSLYQYIYLDKIPNHAIINETVNIAKRRGGMHNGNIVNAILRNIFRSELPNLDEIKNINQRMSIEYSIPKWIIDHWVTHYGVDKTKSIAENLLQSSQTTVRANLTKDSLENIKSMLESEHYHVKQDEEISRCLHVTGEPIINSQAFQKGYISIQDKSSMFVAELAELNKTDIVLDACSAPGGKACHMAEIMFPNGHVDASDIHQHKIKLINQNIKKLGLINIKAFKHDATSKYDKMYDKILVDAPCSGLGVLRHKPEIKYVQSQEEIQSLVQLQLSILENVKQNVKPGGTIIYSTCTIEQMENENVIYTFLKQNKDFEFELFKSPINGELTKTLQILPQDFNSDGFFITKIKRKES